jgi:peptide/nickel transport system permease protein
VASYAAGRLLQLVPTLFFVSVIAFLMVRAIPGDPAPMLLGPQAQPEQVDALRKKMGLDRPIWVQYRVWISDVFHGDLGHSWINGYSVASLIRLKLPATIALAIGTLVVALAVAIPVGILSALRVGSWFDRIASLYCALGLGVPTFWLGILLVLAFSLRLKWLPPSGYVPITEDPLSGLKVLILPSITLGVYYSAIFARFIRSSMLDVLRQDYVKVAMAKGLSARAVVAGHVLRNSMIPLVTVFGIQFGGLLGGVVIVEAIFGWPGLGRLLVTSIQKRDYAVVQGTILLSTVVFLVVNLITDLTYGLLDPRIRTA